MTNELPTQPMPDDVAEACAWLSAAERYTGRDSPLRDRGTAGDVLDILLDVEPPYPPIDTTMPAQRLADAASHAAEALERAVLRDNRPADRLRIAQALGRLREGLP